MTEQTPGVSPKPADGPSTTARSAESMVIGIVASFGSTAIYTIRDATIIKIVDDVSALAVRALIELSSSAGLATGDG
jgi:hypothetical protein